MISIFFSLGKSDECFERERSRRDAATATFSFLLSLSPSSSYTSSPFFHHLDIHHPHIPGSNSCTIISLIISAYVESPRHACSTRRLLHSFPATHVLQIKTNSHHHHQQQQQHSTTSNPPTPLSTTHPLWSRNMTWNSNPYPADQTLRES